MFPHSLYKYMFQIFSVCSLESWVLNPQICRVNYNLSPPHILLQCQPSIKVNAILRKACLARPQRKKEEPWEHVAVDCDPGRPESRFSLSAIGSGKICSLIQHATHLKRDCNSCFRGQIWLWHGECPSPVPSLHKLLFQMTLLEGSLSCWKENRF